MGWGKKKEFMCIATDMQGSNKNIKHMSLIINSVPAHNRS